MDNTGAYLSYGELLQAMSLAGNNKVVKSSITLSAKTSNESGDTFTFTVDSGDPSPEVGDVISQAGKTSTIIDFPSVNEIKIDSTGEIVNGPSYLLHCESVPKYEGERIIQEAMDKIDTATGQFFNKRSGVYKLEGRNTELLQLSIPIIEIEELLINSTKTELKEGEDYDFVAFKGRQKPSDDRRNPKIKLNVGRGRGSIYTASLTSRLFLKNTLTQITGSFGFLEPDGSTPSLIKKAVKILALDQIENPIGESSSETSGTGPLKRIKVDLHEQEFFESSDNKQDSRSSSTGNDEVDKIVAMYRAPLRVGGSFIVRDLRESDTYRNNV